MIQGHGPSEPLAIIIGDGAGPEEVDTNYAFSGNPERTLKQLMGTGPIKWDNFYKTLLIKEKLNFNPGKAKGKKEVPYHDVPENIAKAAQYASILEEEIKVLRPNLVIPTGELSFNLLTGLYGIRKFRGSVLLSTNLCGLPKPFKVLPILGAQPYLNNQYEMRWVTKIDLNKVQKHINDGNPPELNVRLWIAETSTALRNFLERSYKKDGLLVFDIETFMGIPTCISFCFDGVESVCVPFTYKKLDYDTRALMIQLVAQILASPIAKVNQNIKYDWKVLERFGFKVNNVIGDTMLAASCIYPEMPKNLGFLTSIYTDLPYFKDEGKQYDPTLGKRDKFFLYNAKDSLATYQIYTEQVNELNLLGTRQVYENLIKLMPIYRRLEDRGFLIDEEQRLRLYGKYESLFNIECNKLRRWLNNHHFNPLSATQVQTVVYEELGFKRDRRAKGSGEEELEYLMAFGEATKSPVYGHLIVKGIINARKFHKVIELLELPAYEDGRWRCEYKLSGTKTGRTSAGVTTDQLIIRGKKKDFEIIELGHSFQTIGKHGFVANDEIHGKDIRKIFVPTPGYAFVEIDLSQAEARVDAVLSGNYGILSVFDGPVGIHRLTGSWVFNCKPEDIKKNTLEYLMSKTVRHAGERNMKAERLLMMTQQPYRECQLVLNTFHAKQPEIKEVFHREIRDAIDRTKTLIAPNGRRRTFLGRVGDSLYNEAISQLPQAIVSDQTKFSLIPTLDTCPYAHMVNEAHDGTLAEVPLDKIEEYAKEYVKNVTVPIDFRTCSLVRDYQLVIPAEVSVSKGSWYDLEDVKI